MPFSSSKSNLSHFSSPANGFYVPNQKKASQRKKRHKNIIFFCQHTTYVLCKVIQAFSDTFFKIVPKKVINSMKYEQILNIAHFLKKIYRKKVEPDLYVSCAYFPSIKVMHSFLSKKLLLQLIEQFFARS